MNIHGGFWRAKYDSRPRRTSLRRIDPKGLATWNLEFRRVGNHGGGWPGTFEDIAAGFRFPSADRETIQIGHRQEFGDGPFRWWPTSSMPGRARASDQPGGLAGRVVDLQAALDEHLSNDAVAEFLGGKPKEVPEHYHEADPMQLSIQKPSSGLSRITDDTVPPNFSRNYVQQKKEKGENVHLLEVRKPATTI